VSSRGSRDKPVTNQKNVTKITNKILIALTTRNLDRPHVRSRQGGPCTSTLLRSPRFAILYFITLTHPNCLGLSGGEDTLLLAQIYFQVLSLERKVLQVRNGREQAE
jgi:hypothetical protein